MSTSIIHLKRAISCFESQDDLATQLGLYQGQVSQWVTGRRPIPPKHCRKIEALTGGEITRYQLRPDIFGSEPESVQAACFLFNK